eukprot:6011826-Pyramimonas_sp.AAC.1
MNAFIDAILADRCLISHPDTVLPAMSKPMARPIKEAGAVDSDLRIASMKPPRQDKNRLGRSSSELILSACCCSAR